MIQLRNIHKSFGENHVLQGVDLEVQDGEVVSIIGASGSGKSTFLRTINFLEPADDGEIRRLARQAKSAWDRSQQALRNADWSAYGSAMGDLEKSLNAMFPQGIQ
ncbi:ATP-binding cassette domain-containing protein [Pyramidobacter piscolens]|uniref:ATP-binding cassette domain-containing protein n=1 Tax=Pyramidobacter piscolens TaxID=638849 RepID=UPI002493B092|nr:ATP-binding cassette domain-containing protein [Pyramidobacter piscolens]